jgi:L,D-transpeptidase ErfK/SrfK
MARLVWLVLMLLLPLEAALAAPSPPPLYHQVVGGQEYCEVPGRTTLSLLAAAKGVKWTVVARQNHLKRPYRVTKGMVLKINTAHIVPAELRNGLVINLPELLMYHFKDGVCLRRYSLAVGKPSWPTPTGNYKINEKRRNPVWNVPESIQEEMEDEGLEVVEKVPPGPKNPLGKFFMGTTADGVGIHATNRPWSVGYYVSHGCIRMLPEEISQLFPQIAVGTPVKIIYRPIKLALTPAGRIYLEVHPDIYQRKFKPLEYLQELARHYQLTDRIDWDKVGPILKAREGIARDVTREGAPQNLTPAPAPPGSTPREVRLSPLHRKEAKLE